MADLTSNQVCNICCIHYSAGLRCCALGSLVEGGYLFNKGGSIAWIDAAGGLHVGPQSAGATPGPACYGQGGAEPTATDASVVLGYMNPEFFAAGTLPLYPEKAAEVVGASGRLDVEVPGTGTDEVGRLGAAFRYMLGALAVLTIRSLLPYAVAFAAGAMIFVVVEELIPESQLAKNTDLATLATLAGFAVMMTLDVALG